VAVMDVGVVDDTLLFFAGEHSRQQRRDGSMATQGRGERQRRAGCSERMAGLGPQLEVPPIGKRFVSLFCIKRRRKTYLEMFPTRRAALWRVRTTKWVVEVER
jgi:hypothetical protein